LKGLFQISFVWDIIDHDRHKHDSNDDSDDINDTYWSVMDDAIWHNDTIATLLDMFDYQRSNCLFHKQSCELTWIGPRWPNVIGNDVSWYCTLYLNWTIDEYLIEKESGCVFPLGGFCPSL